MDPVDYTPEVVDAADIVALRARVTELEEELATERERCAKIVLSMADVYGGYPDRASLTEIANKIRQE